jgi:hypothetical protein
MSQELIKLIYFIAKKYLKIYFTIAAVRISLNQFFAIVDRANRIREIKIH